MTSRPDNPPKPARTNRQIPVKLVVAVVLVALGVTFIVQNRQAVDIRVFTTTISGPLWAVLAGVLVLGLLAGVLLARGGRERRPR